MRGNKIEVCSPNPTLNLTLSPSPNPKPYPNPKPNPDPDPNPKGSGGGARTLYDFNASEIAGKLREVKDGIENYAATFVRR